MAPRKKVLNMDDAGSAEVLKIEDIQIDPDYQRDLRHDKVETIAKNWDIVKAGPILVSRRKNETLWAVDGQHRMVAALQAGETEIFAHVVTGLNQKQEAELRLARNDRSSDTTFEKFRTRLVMGDPKAHAIEELALQHGTLINTAPNLHAGINCISAVETIYDIDGTGVWLSRAFKTVTEAYGHIGGQTASAALLKSIVWFIDKHLGSGEARYSEFIERLSRAGIDDIDRKAKNQKAAMGGAMWLNYYRAIVEVWNFGRQEKNKLLWKTTGSLAMLGDTYKGPEHHRKWQQTGRTGGGGGGDS